MKKLRGSSSTARSKLRVASSQWPSRRSMKPVYRNTSALFGSVCLASSQFTACALVVAKAVIVVIRQRKVNFTRIRLEAHSAFQGGLGQIETGRCMIVASKIGNAMHSGQQTPSLQKVRIARESFIKKLGCLRQLLSCMDSIGCIGKQRLRAQVKIVREQDP